jgi:hypothetical protein
LQQFSQTKRLYLIWDKSKKPFLPACVDCIDFAECMSLILTTFAVFRQRAVLAAAFCFIFMLFFGSMIDIREVGD